MATLNGLLAAFHNDAERFTVKILHPGVKGGGIVRENLSRAEMQEAVDAVNLLGGAWEIIVIVIR